MKWVRSILTGSTLGVSLALAATLSSTADQAAGAQWIGQIGSALRSAADFLLSLFMSEVRRHELWAALPSPPPFLSGFLLGFLVGFSIDLRFGDALLRLINPPRPDFLGLDPFRDKHSICEIDARFRAQRLVGYESQLAALESLLTVQPAFAWLSLSGTFGSGRTRLALELLRIARRKSWDISYASSTADDPLADRNGPRLRRKTLFAIDEAESSPALWDRVERLRRLSANGLPVRLVLIAERPLDAPGHGDLDLRQSQLPHVYLEGVEGEARAALDRGADIGETKPLFLLLGKNPWRAMAEATARRLDRIRREVGEDGCRMAGFAAFAGPIRDERLQDTGLHTLSLTARAAIFPGALREDLRIGVPAFTSAAFADEVVLLWSDDLSDRGLDAYIAQCIALNAEAAWARFFRIARTRGFADPRAARLADHIRRQPDFEKRTERESYNIGSIVEEMFPELRMWETDPENNLLQIYTDITDRGRIEAVETLIANTAALDALTGYSGILGNHVPFILRKLTWFHARRGSFEAVAAARRIVSYLDETRGPDPSHRLNTHAQLAFMEGADNAIRKRHFRLALELIKESAEVNRLDFEAGVADNFDSNNDDFFFDSCDEALHRMVLGGSKRDYVLLLSFFWSELIAIHDRRAKAGRLSHYDARICALLSYSPAGFVRAALHDLIIARELLDLSRRSLALLYLRYRGCTDAEQENARYSDLCRFAFNMILLLDERRAAETGLDALRSSCSRILDEAVSQSRHPQVAEMVSARWTPRGSEDQAAVSAASSTE